MAVLVVMHLLRIIEDLDPTNVASGYLDGMLFALGGCWVWQGVGPVGYVLALD